MHIKLGKYENDKKCWRLHSTQARVCSLLQTDYYLRLGRLLHETVRSMAFMQDSRQRSKQVAKPRADTQDRSAS